MKVKSSEEYLKKYLTMLETGELSAFDDSSFLEALSADCDKAIKMGASPIGHYLKGIYFIQTDRPDEANAERLKAALLGHCVSAIDYANQSGDSSSDEILGAVKAMNEAGEHLASEQDDFDYSLQQMDSDKAVRVAAVAESVKRKMTSEGLNFQW